MNKKKQFVVWGLGRFGASVAETLVGMGHEVLGIDHDEEVVQEMADKLTHVLSVRSLMKRWSRVWACGTLTQPSLPSGTWNQAFCAA